MSLAGGIQQRPRSELFPREAKEALEIVAKSVATFCMHMFDFIPIHSPLGLAPQSGRIANLESKNIELFSCSAAELNDNLI